MRKCLQNDSLNSPAQHALIPYSGLTVAEASRPHREIKETKKLENTKKRKAADVNHLVANTDLGPAVESAEYKQAKTTTWLDPTIFIHLEAVAQTSKPAMSPTAMLKDLQTVHRKSGMFKNLTTQVLGRMITRPIGGPARWSDDTLKRVRLGRKAKGSVTRAGILVSQYPNSSTRAD